MENKKKNVFDCENDDVVAHIDKNIKKFNELIFRIICVFGKFVQNFSFKFSV